MRNDQPSRAPEVIRLKEAASTNSYIRRLLSERHLQEGSLVVAGSQTAGRGQAGNSWESEPGKNLTFSIVIYPEIIEANEQFLISQITALAVKETLSAYVDNITVKWPNDVYWEDSKICGMLIENDLTGKTIYCSICGIGINVNQKEFLSDAPNPVSLSQITGREYDLQEILELFRRNFYQLYLLLLKDGKEEIRQAYTGALYRGKGCHMFHDKDGLFEAEIEGIEPTGHLKLRLAGGEIRAYAFKEVSFV